MKKRRIEMRKFIVLMLALIMSVSLLTGCGDSTVTEDLFVAPEYNQANNPYDGQLYLNEALRVRFGEDLKVGMEVLTISQSEDVVADDHTDFLAIGNNLKAMALLPSGSDLTFSEVQADFENKNIISDGIIAQLGYAREKDKTVYGHVLAWYAMSTYGDAQEFFFKDDEGNYLDSSDADDHAEMYSRVEWYIDKIFGELYGGEGENNYIDVIDEWDVVNECAKASWNESDPMPTNLSESLRSTDEDKFRATLGDDYMVDVFKIAESVAKDYGIEDKISFTYNDYDSETIPQKNKSIEIILDTMIEAGCKVDALGFQMHVTYGFDKQGLIDTMDTFKDKGVDIQITELDMSVKGLLSYSLDEIHTLQAYEYLEIFEILDDYTIDSICWWGTIDDTSWICFDGPGSDYPLLFDGDSVAKPCFWILVDPAKAVLTPASISAYYAEVPTVDTTAWNFQQFEKFSGDVSGSFNVLWDEVTIYVYVDIDDATVSSADEIRLFFDEDYSHGDEYSGDEKKFTVKRSELTERADGTGYYGVITCNIGFVDEMMTSQIGFDILACDGTVAGYWHDSTYRQEYYPAGYGVISPKKVTKFETATKVTGDITIDGIADEADWADALEITPEEKYSLPMATGTAKILWSEEGLYVFANIKDSAISPGETEAGDKYTSDSIEIYIDQNNSKGTTYDSNDGQFRINAGSGDLSGYGGIDDDLGDDAFVNAKNIEYKVVMTDEGYAIEVLIKFTEVTPTEGAVIGFDFQINDDSDANNTRDGIWTWADSTRTGYQSSVVFGLLELGA